MLNFLPDALPDSNSTLSEQQEEEEEAGRWALPDRATAAVKRYFQKVKLLVPTNIVTNHSTFIIKVTVYL